MSMIHLAVTPSLNVTLPLASAPGWSVTLSTSIVTDDAPPGSSSSGESAPSAGGAGSGARFRSVADARDDDDEEALCCKVGGAGTAEDVVVTFGLLCREPRRGEIASEDGDGAVGRARSSGETAAAS